MDVAEADGAGHVGVDDFSDLARGERGPGEDEHAHDSRLSSRLPGEKPLEPAMPSSPGITTRTTGICSSASVRSTTAICSMPLARRRLSSQTTSSWKLAPAKAGPSLKLRPLAVAVIMATASAATVGSWPRR